jgi:carbonic anhydrase
LIDVARVVYCGADAKCSDVDRYIREDVEWLRNQPLLRSGKGVDVQGFLYDIKTGKLRKVT